MEIGKNITTFRKDAGMTQEDLAGRIGVSAQAVSKWETGVSMPDILLLPVIADAFDVTVDELYNGRQSKENRPLHMNEAPEAAFCAMFDTTVRVWNDENMTREKLTAVFEADGRCASFIAGDNGGAVRISREMGIVLRNFGTKTFFQSLNLGEESEILSVLGAKGVSQVLAYLMKLGKKLFTAAGVAKSVGLSVEDVSAVLEKLCALELVRAEIIGGDEEELANLAVYTNKLYEEGDRLFQISAILLLAQKFAEGSYYYGYRGAMGYRGETLPIEN